jgi:hypothetical protein
MLAFAPNSTANVSLSQATGCLLASLVAAAHATVGADGAASAELLRGLNGVWSELKPSSGAKWMSASLHGVDIAEEVRAQLLHLCGVHVLQHSAQPRYAPPRTLANHPWG